MIMPNARPPFGNNPLRRTLPLRPLLALLGLLLLAGLAPRASALVLQGGFIVHDPSRIVKCNGRYYAYSTGPNIAMRWSNDLIHWNYGPGVMSADDNTNAVPLWAQKAVPGNGGNSVWAPDVLFFNGLYHLWYCYSQFGTPNSVVGLLTSPTLDPNDPAYHWTDQGEVIGSAKNGNPGLTGTVNCIDPCPVYDAAGNLWLSMGSYNDYGIGLIRLDNTTGLRNSDPTQQTIYHLAGINMEASYILYHNGYYYLFENVGTCCSGAKSTYHIMMGRSTQIIGPYLDKNNVPLLATGGSYFLGDSKGHIASDPTGTRIGPGHFGLFSDGTIDRLTYHLEYDGTNYGVPTLNIETLLWDSSGWPVSGTDLPNGTYKIASKATGLVLGVHTGSNGDGTPVDQNTASNRAYQQWTVATTLGGTPQTGNDGYYSLTSVGSGKVLDLYYCDPADGTTIDQYTWFNNACQRWMIEQTGDGSYRVVSAGGGGAVTVPGSTGTPGALLLEYGWNGGDNQKWSFLAQAPAPAAPTSLTAAGDSGQVALSWTASAGASSYNVYRGTAAGAEGATPVAAGVTGPSYTDAGLQDGTSYFYTVTAVSPGGESGRSGEASATTPPAAPANLTATGGRSQISLSWSASTGAASYSVYRSAASGGETLLASGVTGTSYADSGQPDGTTGFYQVTATDSAGESGRSNEASATTKAPDLFCGGLTSSDSTPGVGDSVTLTATVTNNSAGTTATNETVTFADGGTAIGTATLASLAPGASATVHITWTPQTAGTLSLTATAAPLPGETNTANNTASLSLTVYNYYTYTTTAGFAAKGTGNGTTDVDDWYKFNIGVPMNMVKEVRVTVPVTTYDASGSQAVGAPNPHLESDTGDGIRDLALVGTVTPTGPGNWAMSSQAPAVVATVKPLADNYIDLWVRGLNKTTSIRDTVVTGGLTVSIKYLAP